MHAEESGAITSLPILFENLVVEVLLTLKEVVIETHHGETEVTWQCIHLVNVMMSNNYIICSSVELYIACLSVCLSGWLSVWLAGCYHASDGIAQFYSKKEIRTALA